MPVANKPSALSHLPAACIEQLDAHHRLAQGLLLVAAEAAGVKHLNSNAPEQHQHNNTHNRCVFPGWPS
jgi:hypothetical protein